MFGTSCPKPQPNQKLTVGPRFGRLVVFGPEMSAADANARLALAVSTIGFGYFMKRVGLADIDVGKALLKILFNATLPSVLLMTFASLTFDATSVAVSLCAMAQAAVLFAAHLAFRGTGRNAKDTALLAGSCVGVNLGTFAYPLVEAVWGPQGLTRLVLFDSVNQWSLLIIAPLIYASTIAGPAFSPKQALNNVKKQLLSPCLLAMFAAVALRVVGLTLPAPVVAFTSSLAVANKPVALLALGVLFEPALRSEQIRDVASLLALRYGACLLLGAGLVAAFSSLLGPAVLGVVLAALISPVPLLTVTYAVDYGCDVGLGAAAVNAAMVCSFALLLAVANADLTHPAAAKALAAAGAALAALGAAGARNGGDGAQEEMGWVDDIYIEEALRGDAGGGGVVKAIARSSPAARRQVSVVWFGGGERVTRKSFGITRPSSRASSGRGGRGAARGMHDNSSSGGVRRPGRTMSYIAGSCAIAVF